MTIHDSKTLKTLIGAYEHLYLFVDPVPSPLQLSKLFLGMRRFNGGLVLLGVRGDGTVVGVPDDTVDRIYHRFENLCRHLTTATVEIGTLKLAEKTLVFLIFNPIPKNLQPLGRYQRQIERVEVV